MRVAVTEQVSRLDLSLIRKLTFVSLGFPFERWEAAELMTKQFANPIDKFFKLNMAMAVRTWWLSFQLPAASIVAGYKSQTQKQLGSGLLATSTPVAAVAQPSSVLYHSNRIKT